MQPIKPGIYLTAMLAAAAVGLFGFSLVPRFPALFRPAGSHATGTPANPPNPAPTSPAPLPGVATKADATKHLHSVLASLKAATSAADSRKILADLHAYLTSLPPALAAAIIADFLADPSQNAPTRIEFAIGQAGVLTGHPSLRVALLDWLGQIDPRQAGEVARQILATPTDADEWAVCLRNCARATADSNDYLRAKTEELIGNPKWRANPSVGFFEAFDVLVHTRATASTPLLSSLIQQKDRRDLAHAGFLTLDRLVQSDPAAVMTQLAANRPLQQSRPEMVANMLARADLRDAPQQQLVRSYLLDPARSATELAAFASVYPSANFAISNNLLTANPSLARDELAARDAAALGIITTWLADPAFASIKPHLTVIHNRLATFVGQSGK
ncbi:MAG: hypothetical protein WCO57_07615 [Verrucomicrobiota bacterium]